MSRERVEAFERATAAVNRRDIEGSLEDLDPEVEWHPEMQSLLEGGAPVYRGHEGVRTMVRDFYDAFGEIHIEYSQIRDLDDRVLGIGHLRTRGLESGVETESPLGTVVDFKNDKALRIRTYLDHKEALKVAGLSE